MYKQFHIQTTSVLETFTVINDCRCDPGGTGELRALQTERRWRRTIVALAAGGTRLQKSIVSWKMSAFQDRNGQDQEVPYVSSTTYRYWAQFPRDTDRTGYSAGHLRWTTAHIYINESKVLQLQILCSLAPNKYPGSFCLRCELATCAIEDVAGVVRCHHVGMRALLTTLVLGVVVLRGVAELQRWAWQRAWDSENG